MICPSCNKDSHPVIEGDQNGRFVYTCGNAECHAFIRLHERSEAKPTAPKPDAHVAPAAEARAQLLHVHDYQTEGDHLPFDADSLTANASKRLAQIDADIARLEVLKVERSRLRAMLRAGNRKPRAAKSNVVHIAAKKAAQ